MTGEKKDHQWLSFAGALLMALILPGMLRLTNRVTRLMAGAEGRLAAIRVDTAATPEPADNLKPAVIWTESESQGRLQAIKPGYVKINDIFHTYRVAEITDGKLTMNWNQLDRIIGEIGAAGGRPFINLGGQIPEAMGSGNREKWIEAVRLTVQRYSGAAGIAGVYYEIGDSQSSGNPDEMQIREIIELYENAVSGAGQATDVREYMIGGPGAVKPDSGLMNEWLSWAAKNHTRLDFVSWLDGGTDPDKTTADYRALRRKASNYGLSGGVEMVISTTEARAPARAGEAAVYPAVLTRRLPAGVKIRFSQPDSDGTLARLGGLGFNRLPVTGEGSWVQAVATAGEEGFWTVLMNYDPDGTHYETVPVSFVNLPAEKFRLTTEDAGGKREEEIVATGGVVQTVVNLPANTTAAVELKRATAFSQAASE